jgi:hypothetical protein
MDPHVDRLRTLFLSHPAWLRAARAVREGSTSRVLFSHVSTEYQLVRREGESVLLEGTASDPDFAFRFTPASIDALACVQSEEVADFAIALFDCIVSDDPERQVGLRVLASFPRLMMRGYVGLLFGGGPRLLSYGASRGVRNVSDLRKFLKQARASDPRWEALT